MRLPVLSGFTPWPVKEIKRPPKRCVPTKAFCRRRGRRPHPSRNQTGPSTWTILKQRENALAHYHEVDVLGDKEVHGWSESSSPWERNFADGLGGVFFDPLLLTPLVPAPISVNHRGARLESQKNDYGTSSR